MSLSYHFGWSLISIASGFGSSVLAQQTQGQSAVVGVGLAVGLAGLVAAFAPIIKDYLGYRERMRKVELEQAHAKERRHELVNGAAAQELHQALLSILMGEMIDAIEEKREWIEKTIAAGKPVPLPANYRKRSFDSWLPLLARFTKTADSGHRPQVGKDTEVEIKTLVEKVSQEKGS